MAAVPRGGRGSQLLWFRGEPGEEEWRPSLVAAEDRNTSSIARCAASRKWRPSLVAAEDRNNIIELIEAAHATRWRPSLVAAEDRNRCCTGSTPCGRWRWRPSLVAAEDRNSASTSGTAGAGRGWRPSLVAAEDRNWCPRCHSRQQRGRGGRPSWRPRIATRCSACPRRRTRVWRPSLVAAEDRNLQVVQDVRGGDARGGRPSWRPRIATATARCITESGGVAAVPRGGRGSQPVCREGRKPCRSRWRPSLVAAEDRNATTARDAPHNRSGGGRPSWRPRIATSPARCCGPAR